jgi:tripartite-type tricarboxylate transporter receptor subunit TctC
MSVASRNRRRFLAECAALLATTRAWAQTQAFPTQPLQLIVPFPPGGATDSIMRLVGQKLSNRLGQQVIINNVPGAGTIIASEKGAKAAPDGYTLLGVTAAFSANPALHGKMPYSNGDFAAVTELSAAPNVLVINPSLPVNSPEEFVRYAKAHPREVNFGSAGNGTSNHLSGELLKSMAGIEIVHVPYKGDAPCITDLIGGQIQALFIGWAPIAQHVRSGKLKALAVTSMGPTDLVPGLPPLSRAVPGFESSVWNGIVVPARTPVTIIARLHTEITQVLAQPAVQDEIRTSGFAPIGSSAEQFGKFLRNEEQRMAELIHRAQIKVD